MPHFFHDTGEFEATEIATLDVGRKVSAKAERIFCNSNFTKSYLPNSKLKVDPEKIEVVYLPLLNEQGKPKGQFDDKSELETLAHLNLRTQKYLFYPTQPRPNKNLSFLIDVFEELKKRGHDLTLVLTKRLESDAKAFRKFQRSIYRHNIVFVEHVTDETLRSLYKHSAVLPFTSLAEGNFPPQIYEAVTYGVPVVAFDLGFISERLRGLEANTLQLVEVNDLQGFVDRCEYVMNNKHAVLDKQNKLKACLDREAEQFTDEVLRLFKLV